MRISTRDASCSCPLSDHMLLCRRLDDVTTHIQHTCTQYICKHTHTHTHTPYTHTTHHIHTHAHHTHTHTPHTHIHTHTHTQCNWLILAFPSYSCFTAGRRCHLTTESWMLPPPYTTHTLKRFVQYTITYHTRVGGLLANTVLPACTIAIQTGVPL